MAEDSGKYVFTINFYVLFPVMEQQDIAKVCNMQKERNYKVSTKCSQIATVTGATIMNALQHIFRRMGKLAKVCYAIKILQD